MQNINTSGTFQEYMESVKAETQEQLGHDYTVELKNEGKHAWYDDGIKHLVYSIQIVDGEGWRVHFAISKIEFDRNKQNAKRLVQLAKMRFIDAEWSLRHAKGCVCT